MGVRERTKERCEKVGELIKGGLSQTAACTQVGLAQSLYWQYRKENGQIKGRQKSQKAKSKHVFVDLPRRPIEAGQMTTAPTRNIAVVFCAAEQLRSILREFGQ